MISVEQTQTIHLGRTGEQDVTEIVFNIAPWIAQFGQGNVLLNVKRACDTIPYPANIVVVGNTAVWTVSKKDVESYGTGKAELTYLVDGQIKKSVLYKTYTEKSLADITPTPENGDTWLDAMTKQVLKAEGHSTQSESYAHGGTGTRVDENTDNAKYYSEQADLDAQTTDADRQVVEQAKTEVLESAKQVGLDKQAVENVVKNVTDAETRIGNVENDIKLMQTDVKSNKDAVDTTKTEITGMQTDVIAKAQQVESDRIKVENAVLDLSKPVKEHNVSPTAHEDIRTEVSKKANKTEIPTKVSDLTNDSGYLTKHQDISGKADKTEIPTKVSQLQNDSGYLTAHQDISGKVDKVVQTQKDAEQDSAIKKNADDVLKCVKKTDVDVEMSDVSENPVQNKVVKQYMDNHVPKENDYELIEDIKINSEIKEIKRNLKPDGTQYNFKKLKVIFEFAKSSKSSSILYSNIDDAAFIVEKPISEYNVQYAFVELYPQNGYLILKGTPSPVFRDVSPLIGIGPLNYSPVKEKLITKVLFSVSNVFPIGSSIQIWGVRA